jgi:hypothetical protein
MRKFVCPPPRQHPRLSFYSYQVVLNRVGLGW